MPDCHLEADAVASSVATIEGLMSQINELTVQLNAEAALLSERMAILDACLNSGIGMSQDTGSVKPRFHPALQKIRERFAGCRNQAVLAQANLKQFIEKRLVI